MNLVKKLTFALLVSFTAIGPVFSQSTEKPSTERGRLMKIKTGTKHRAPSNVFLEYVYTGDGFCFLTTDLFETLDVTISNMETNQSWTATLSSGDDCAVETGPLPGGYYCIYAVSESGVEWYGEINLP